MCTLWTNSSLRQDGQYDMITNLSIMHLYIHCTHDNLCNSHMKAITFMISQWKNTCVRTCTRTAQVVFVFLFNMTRLCTTRRMQSIVGRAQQVLHVCEACISLPLLAVSRNTILQHLDTPLKNFRPPWIRIATVFPGFFYTYLHLAYALYCDVR